jgi:hypothetical protein
MHLWLPGLSPCCCTRAWNDSAADIRYLPERRAGARSGVRIHSRSCPQCGHCEMRLRVRHARRLRRTHRARFPWTIQRCRGSTRRAGVAHTLDPASAARSIDHSANGFCSIPGASPPTRATGPASLSVTASTGSPSGLAVSACTTRTTTSSTQKADSTGHQVP